MQEEFGKGVPLKLPSYNRLWGGQDRTSEVELGRLLFSDPILSRNNDVSCATCHLASHGFADGNSLSFGTLGRGGPNGRDVGQAFGEGVLSVNRGPGDDSMGFVGKQFMFRNSLSTINVVYRIDPSGDEGLFWDGRFGNLDFQVLLPIHTSIEMCGDNPLPDTPEGKRMFAKDGILFKSPVKIVHSHSYDPVSGEDTGFFNSRPEMINGIEAIRPNGRRAIPTRNECLAIALAKIRLVPEYRRRFKEAFGSDAIEDRFVARALASFLMTHVASDTPYDRFLKKENSLTDQQMLGMAIFMTPAGQKVPDSEHPGAGCANCHSPPHFGGKGFASLGVVSDERSSLTRPDRVSDLNNGFFTRARVQRGLVPNCHIEKVTVSQFYAPDIGRAGASFAQDDCFKFRIPPLRNVIETYPYFHHGTARAQGLVSDDLKERALAALKQVIVYHLRGPVDPSFVARSSGTKGFYDETFQRDQLIPFYAQDFSNDPSFSKLKFPIELSDEELEALVQFVGVGLWDKNATRRGALGNDLSHPKEVPSGFQPTITRDQGHQMELPPAADLP